MVLRTQESIKKIEDYLSISLTEENHINLNSIELKGSMGDPSLNLGQNNEIDSNSINKWKGTFDTMLRKKIAVQYLEQINDEYFRFLGKSRIELIEELNTIKTSFSHEIKSSPLDLYHLMYNKFISKFKPYLIFPKIFKRHHWIKNNFLN